MAIGTVAVIDGGGRSGQSIVDRERIARRRAVENPVLDTLDPRQINRLRRCPGTHSRAQITLVDRIVIAVPMQPDSLAHTLIPDRHEIGGADTAIVHMSRLKISTL